MCQVVHAAQSKTVDDQHQQCAQSQGAGDEDIAGFGELLHRSWQLKRRLSSQISTPYIDYLYDTARHAGATGGKILGAGGGGFILFFVKPELQPMVSESLHGLLHVPFRFENSGSQIIFYEPDVQYTKVPTEAALCPKP